ncbi:MAG: inositol monophosphatase family protein [Chlamydiota bacterium]
MIPFSEITLGAIEAARLGGEIVKKGFHSSFFIRNKEGQNNLVTEYDLASEKRIISFIKTKFPSHQIVAEESGGNLSSESIQWIIDPIDGTSNFAHGIPTFSISIGVRQKNTLITGVVYHPLTDELFVAEKNKGAFLNDKKISISSTESLEEAFIAFELPYNLQTNPHHIIDRIQLFLQKGCSLQRTGSSALDLAYLACGRYDAFFSNGLGAWDCAAGILLVEEAGGAIASWDKTPFSLATTQNALIAANKKIMIPLQEIFFQEIS